MNPMKHTEEYIKIIDHVYGTYFDATYGFHLQMKELSEQEELDTNHLESHHEKISKIHKMSFKPLSYKIEGEEDIEHSATIRDYKARNWPDDGSNYQWAAKMCLVTIYEFWEERYRELIAMECGLSSKDDLKINEFGELGYFRNAILHNLGVGTKDFNKIKVFTWFKYHDEIRLDTVKISFIIKALKQALS